MDAHHQPKNEIHKHLQKADSFHKSLLSGMPGADPFEQRQHQTIESCFVEKDALDNNEPVKDQDVRSFLEKSFTAACEVMEQTFEQIGLSDDAWSSFKRDLRKSLRSVFKTIGKMDQKVLLCTALVASAQLSGAYEYQDPIRNCPGLYKTAGCIQIDGCPTNSTVEIHEVGNQREIASEVRENFGDVFGNIVMKYAKNGNYCDPSHIDFYFNSSDAQVNSNYSSPYFNPSAFPKRDLYGSLKTAVYQAVTAKLVYDVLGIPEQTLNSSDSWLVQATIDCISSQEDPDAWLWTHLNQTSSYTERYVGGRFLCGTLTPQNLTDLVHDLQNGTISEERIQDIVSQWPKYLKDMIEAQDYWLRLDIEDLKIFSYIAAAVAGIAVLGCACDALEKGKNRPIDAAAQRERVRRKADRIDCFLRYSGYRAFQRWRAEQRNNHGKEEIPLNVISSAIEEITL